MSQVNMLDDENVEMEDVATPSDFLEHIPTKAQRLEVNCKFRLTMDDGTSPVDLVQGHLDQRPLSEATQAETSFTCILVALLR
jgi:hypothetical protein